VVQGIHAFNVEMANKMMESGFRFVALMSDISAMSSTFK